MSSIFFIRPFQNKGRKNGFHNGLNNEPSGENWIRILLPPLQAQRTWPYLLISLGLHFCILNYEGSWSHFSGPKPNVIWMTPGIGFGNDICTAVSASLLWLRRRIEWFTEAMCNLIKRMESSQIKWKDFSLNTITESDETTFGKKKQIMKSSQLETKDSISS